MFIQILVVIALFVVITVGMFKLFSGLSVAKTDRQRVIQLLAAFEQMLLMLQRIEDAAAVVAADLVDAHQRADEVNGDGMPGMAADAASRSPITL